MRNHYTKTHRYRWMLVIAVAGFLAIPVTGSGGTEERLTSLAAVEDGIHETLAHPAEVVEVNVDGILVKEEEKEDETDWTLASDERAEEEEVNWTLA